MLVTDIANYQPRMGLQLCPVVAGYLFGYNEYSNQSVALDFLKVAEESARRDTPGFWDFGVENIPRCFNSEDETLPSTVTRSYPLIVPPYFPRVALALRPRTTPRLTNEVDVSIPCTAVSTKAYSGFIAGRSELERCGTTCERRMGRYPPPLGLDEEEFPAGEPPAVRGAPP